MKRLAIMVLCVIALTASGCGNRWRTPDGSGTIEATEIRVAAEVPGQLLEVRADEGMLLARGDTVAIIDPTDYLTVQAAVDASTHPADVVKVVVGDDDAGEVVRGESQIFKIAQNGVRAAGHAGA